MAVIRQEERWYEEGSHKKYVQIVKCNSKGVFSCTVPDEWQNDNNCVSINNKRTNERGLCADSLDELEKKYNNLYGKYNDKEEITELVIVFDYQFGVSAKVNKKENKIVKSENKGCWLDCRDDNRSFNKNLGFVLSAATFRKIKTVFKSNDEILYKYDKVDNDCKSDPDKGKQLETYLEIGMEISPYNKEEREDEISYSDEMRDCLNILGEKVVMLIVQLKKIFYDGKIKTISGKEVMKLLEYNK